MKLIIDIPEIFYQNEKENKGYVSDLKRDLVWDAMINGTPLVEQEPKTGHWIYTDEEPHEDYECDKCGYFVSTYTANIEPCTEYKFCPNCGAIMVVPQERG